ncbi:MAG TPA: DUF1801 domain-containing protein [Ignavibacteriaceae bacterium]|nr:DUF1801 domain-containing protein [Ignavibacteriaceae bacterium]
MKNLNRDVTKFLDEQNHPLREVIEKLRKIILQSNSEITENIKWNGPNYCFNNEDRITIKLHPPKQIQLIFHRGSKKQIQPEDKLIADNSGLLIWRENDRALVNFKSIDELKKSEPNLKTIITKWIEAAK